MFFLPLFCEHHSAQLFTWHVLGLCEAMPGTVSGQEMMCSTQEPRTGLSIQNHHLTEEMQTGSADLDI